MNKTSILQDTMLDALLNPTMTSRRLFTAPCDRRGVCEVLTSGLHPCVIDARRSDFVPRLIVPRPLINKVH